MSVFQTFHDLFILICQRCQTFWQVRRNKNKEKIGTWFLFLAKPLLRWLAAKWNSDDIETSFNQSHISNGNPREKVCFGGKFRGWQAEEKNLTAGPKDSLCWFCSSWGPAVAPDSRPDAGSLDVSSSRLILRNYSPRVCSVPNSTYQIFSQSER